MQGFYLVVDSIYPFPIPTSDSVGLSDDIRYPVDCNRMRGHINHMGGLYTINQSLLSKLEDPIKFSEYNREDDYLDLPVVARDGHSDVPTDYSNKCIQALHRMILITLTMLWVTVMHILCYQGLYCPISFGSAFSWLFL